MIGLKWIGREDSMKDCHVNYALFQIVANSVANLINALRS